MPEGKETETSAWNTTIRIAGMLALTALLLLIIKSIIIKSVDTAKCRPLADKKRINLEEECRSKGGVPTEPYYTWAGNITFSNCVLPPSCENNK